MVLGVHFVLVEHFVAMRSVWSVMRNHLSIFQLVQKSGNGTSSSI